MNTLLYQSPISLDCGRTLQEFELAYTTYGKLNREGDNVIWIMHALTANADPVEWWPGMVGEGLFFDPDQYYIVCANIVGSCYGSTSPRSICPSTGMPYAKEFPIVTNRDVVRMFDLLRMELGIRRIRFSIGASLGGQQLLEWAIECPNLFEIICPVSTNAKHSAWGIAYNEAQRMVLEEDPNLWSAESGLEGSASLDAARAVAMMSYRTYKTYEETQTDDDDRIDNFSASSYQRYQGQKLRKRFDGQSYWYLSKMMDAHNVGRHRGGLDKALSLIQARTYVIGVSSDNLFPVQEQRYIADHIPGATYIEIDSFYGHDGFLVEFEKLSRILASFFYHEE